MEDLSDSAVINEDSSAPWACRPALSRPLATCSRAEDPELSALAPLGSGEKALLCVLVRQICASKAILTSFQKNERTSSNSTFCACHVHTKFTCSSLFFFARFCLSFFFWFSVNDLFAIKPSLLSMLGAVTEHSSFAAPLIVAGACLSPCNLFLI